MTQCNGSVTTLTRCCDAPHAVVRMATVFSEWSSIRCTACGDQPCQTYNTPAAALPGEGS